MADHIHEAGPKRIPSTRSAFTKLAQIYPEHAFVLEVRAVHEWSMGLLRDHGINALAVIPPKKASLGKKPNDDDATRLAKKNQAGELQIDGTGSSACASGSPTFATRGCPSSSMRPS